MQDREALIESVRNGTPCVVCAAYGVETPATEIELTVGSGDAWGWPGTLVRVAPWLACCAACAEQARGYETAAARANRELDATRGGW